jgi:hypothetical protein
MIPWAARQLHWRRQAPIRLAPPLDLGDKHAVNRGTCGLSKADTDLTQFAKGLLGRRVGAGRLGESRAGTDVASGSWRGARLHGPIFRGDAYDGPHQYTPERAPATFRGDGRPGRLKLGATGVSPPRSNEPRNGKEGHAPVTSPPNIEEQQRALAERLRQVARELLEIVALHTVVGSM